ncbi:MAG: ATP synthase F0 subunit B [Acidobacteriota bacterium]
MENFPHLPTLLSVAVATLLLVAILNRWMFKPLNGIISERQRRTEAAQRCLQEAQQAQSARLAEMEAGLAEARRRAYEVREAAQRAGRERREALLGAAREEAQQLLEEARAEIAADLESARCDLETQAKHLSRSIVERLLGRALTAASHEGR